MDAALLQELYERYQRELLLYLYSLCGSRAQAEDLLQDTFLKALLSLPEGHPNFRAWLYLVARNLFLNQKKREERLTSLPEETPDGADDPAARLIADEGRAVLWRGLQKLDARKREILLLQYFSRLSQKEIAAVLRLSPENVRVLAGRGRRELRRVLEEMGYEYN